ncbi:hypothetical protein AB0P15_11250 [Streptomyces sp. NPDC087917]|uniref:hypothetical protein n=1 Tax=Streptomyces sp. NPDC087917 TaxID=3155060 RepID=UPI003419969F
MLKPTRTVLALAAGSLALGLTGAGFAVADDGPRDHESAPEYVNGDEPEYTEPGVYPKPRHALGKVVSRGPLKVRSRPTTHSSVLGTVHPHQKLTLECKKRGQEVSGNNIWYRLDTDDRERPSDGNDGADGSDGRDEMDGMDGMNGSDASDGKHAAKDKRMVADRKDAWVSARYVKDITPVKWCR